MESKTTCDEAFPKEMKTVSIRQTFVVECIDLDVNIAKKPILKSIKAAFLSGTVTALMGPSGAGKTTMLNVLSNRDEGHITKGKILLNSQSMTRKYARALTSLTPQLDVLIAVLTPRECFTYAAQLALDLPADQIKKRVEDVIDILSLKPCANVMIGDEDIKGLSGGERKRTSIGLDLLTDPKIMYLDEPTSGLDCKVAADVVKLLRKVASEAGRTIICTIHQPSFQLFSEFDYLVLLNRGEVAYNGAVEGISFYFSSLGFPVPDFTNPADHMIMILCNDVPKEYHSFSEAFNQSAWGKNYEEFRQRASESAKGLCIADVDLSRGTSWFNQFFVLIRRAAYVTRKDRKQMITRLAQHIIVAIIVGALYFDLANTQKTRFERQSALFIVVLFSLMSTIMGTVITLPMEKAMIKREYGNGNFCISAFFIGRIIVLYSFQSVYAIIFAIILYFMVGLQGSIEHFLTFLSLLLLLGFIAVTLGYLFGTLFPTITGATAIVPILIIPLVFFSGLFISLDNIPVYFVWMYYLSFVQYAYQILLVNEFEDKLFEPCSVQDLATPGDCPLGPCNADPFNQTLSAESCSGQLIIDLLNYSVDKQYINWAILVTFWMVLLVLSGFTLNRYLKS